MATTRRWRSGSMAKAVDLKHRRDDWAVHIFGEHHKEADAWAEKGALGLKD